MTQPLRLAHFQAAILRLPAVKRLLTHTMLTAQLWSRHTSFRLLQDPYYLLFRVTALPHLKSSSSGPHRPNLSENSHFRWTKSRDAAQPEAIRKRAPVLSAIHLAMLPFSRQEGQSPRNDLQRTTPHPGSRLCDLARLCWAGSCDPSNALLIYIYVHITTTIFPLAWLASIRRCASGSCSKGNTVTGLAL